MLKKQIDKQDMLQNYYPEIPMIDHYITTHQQFCEQLIM